MASLARILYIPPETVELSSLVLVWKESQPEHQVEGKSAFFNFTQDYYWQRIRENKEGLAHLHGFLN